MYLKNCKSRTITIIIYNFIVWIKQSVKFCLEARAHGSVPDLTEF